MEQGSVADLDTLSDEQLSELCKQLNLQEGATKEDTKEIIINFSSKVNIDVTNQQTPLSNPAAKKSFELNEEQKQIAKEFHSMVLNENLGLESFLKEIYNNEVTVEDLELWFLFARKWNKESALERLKNFFPWRKELGVINFQTVEKEFKLGKYLILHKSDGSIAFDKQGRVIIWFRPRFHNIRESDPQDILKLIIFLTEYALKKKAVQANGLVMFVVPRGSGLSNFDPRIPRLVGPALTNRMPIRVGAAYPFEPGWIFKIIFAVISQVMKSKFIQRVRPIRDIDELREVFDDSIIPTEIGGSNSWDINDWLPIISKH
jgi:hypothetical protein